MDRALPYRPLAQSLVAATSPATLRGIFMNDVDPLLVLAFGALLSIGVLLSERAARSVLSIAVLFLAGGFLLGGGVLHWVELSPSAAVLSTFSELALFAILFVDGTELSAGELKAAWRLPGRALLVGMPLTLAALAFAARFVLGLSWGEAILVGAILSPTDPVLVRTILEHEAVPLRLRRLLSVESGLNDGLALPVVLTALAVMQRDASHVEVLLLEVGLGIVIGVAVPALFLWMEARRFFGAGSNYQPLAGVAIASVLLGVTKLVSANEFLAAFTGGITLATCGPRFASEMQRVAVPVTELLKLATLFVFGIVLSVPMLTEPGLPGLAFGLIALLAARPVALALALWGGGLTRAEWVTAAWFGPKGFASLLYAWMVLHSGIARADSLFGLIALVIVLSIVSHSSSDVAFARRFRRTPDD